jgi:hypothetical protein
MSNVFVNLESKNETTSPAHVIVDESREPSFLHSPEYYDISIDRFSLSSCWLPVFQSSSELVLELVRLSDSEKQTITLDFTDAVDAHKMMYQRSAFVTVMNAALQAACDGFALVGDAPTVSLDRSTGFATLTYDGIADFSELYTLQFNEPLFAIFDTFPYKDVLYDNDFFKLDLSGGTSVSTVEDVNLSPVDKVYIKCNSIPLATEFTPSATSSRASEAILTDFEFGGVNRFPLQNISYTATTGQYRFHTCLKGIFKRIRLEFYYKTYSNETFALSFLPGGSCSVKLFFKPNYARMQMKV